MWRRLPPRLRSWLGIEANVVSHGERLISTLGGFIGILLILAVSWAVLQERQAALLIVTSMGASAVLLFAVPHGALSQPWAVIGGHMVSAFVGVVCAMLVANPFVAAALGVGLSIGAMHYLHCIHPPGGATALTAVIGGPAVHELGFQFLITPVLLNVAIILLTAIGVNYFFPWRRYPAALVRNKTAEVENEKKLLAEGSLSYSDLEYALRQVNSILPISGQELARVYQLAAQHSKTARLEPWQIRLHEFYSNGEFGDDWAVRQVVDESGHHDPEKDKIIFKTVAGKGRRRSGVSTRAEFARWARYEVFRDENSWQRRP